MRISQVGSLSLFLSLVCSLPALSQNQASAAPQPAATAAREDSEAPAAPPPASFNEVMDRVVQKEHLFVAQMRHLRPLVETYLQNIKTAKDGNPVPASDHYFLGRLDMSDGPEDTSFVGQPGFGHRMLNRLTGLYAMHF